MSELLLCEYCKKPLTSSDELHTISHCAEYMRQRITDLEDMLIDMVEQYCQYSYKPGTEDVDKYSHDFMSTGEYVFAYLVEHGLAEWTDERKAFITMKERSE